MHRGQVKHSPGARGEAIETGQELTHDPLDACRVPLLVGTPKQAAVQALVVGACREPRTRRSGGGPGLAPGQVVVDDSAGDLGDPFLDRGGDALQDRPFGVA